MADITYVRREMLPPQDAPGSAVGPVAGRARTCSRAG